MEPAADPTVGPHPKNALSKFSTFMVPAPILPWRRWCEPVLKQGAVVPPQRAEYLFPQLPRAIVSGSSPPTGILYSQVARARRSEFSS